MHHGIWKSTHQLIMLHKSGKTRNTIVLSHLQPKIRIQIVCLTVVVRILGSLLITHYKHGFSQAN